MTSIPTLWITLFAGIIGCVCLIAFMATGKKHAALRVVGGLLVIVAVVANFLPIG